jgi:hypothetical protein
MRVKTSTACSGNPIQKYAVLAAWHIAIGNRACFWNFHAHTGI